MASYDVASNICLPDIARHVVGRHFEPSLLELHGIL
jgi:hypothetical protein